MFKVTNFSRSLMIASVIAASGLATVAAHADAVHIRVGDVSQADGARAFNQRLAAATRSLCGGYALTDLAGRGACQAAVRDEALAQLTPNQRAELATPNHGLAMAAAGSH